MKIKIMIRIITKKITQIGKVYRITIYKINNTKIDIYNQNLKRYKMYKTNFLKIHQIKKIFNHFKIFKMMVI